MQIEWELSESFASLDDQGIRTAACIVNPADSNDYSILVGTQGGSLCEYHVPSKTIQPIAYQHNQAVTVVTSVPGGSTEIVTACKDGIIRYFGTATYDCHGTLQGHTKPVTCLSWAQIDQQYFLLSGSWDGTVRVWDWQRKVALATLEGHENSTCVTALPSVAPQVLRIATGSAGNVVNSNTIQDYQVRLWTVHVTTGQVQLVHSIKHDHQGPIRGIHCSNDDSLLMTCSNDGTVQLRDAETGKATGTLVFVPSQHQQEQQLPMLLSVTTSSNDTCIASAEDGHVVFWSLDQQQQPQIILHPSTVWNVLPLPNGDVATCCDDGHLRIFTRTTERGAPLQEQQAFQQVVLNAHTKSQNGPTAEEIAKLPQWEQHTQLAGTSEGQVQVFQKNGTAIAAQYNMASATWVEVGQVVGSNNDSSSSSSGIIDGVQYDHVLPIEVDQTGGGVAQLRVGYNSGENTFVAAQRFLDAHQLPQHYLSQIADYIQQRVGTATTTTTTQPSTAITGTPLASFQYLPMAHAKTFDQVTATTLAKIQSKLEDCCTDDAQKTTLASLVETLAATQRYHVSHVTHEHWKLLEQLFIQQTSQVFPALDLARMAVLHPDGRQYNALFLVTAACHLDESSSGTLSGPAAVAVPLLTLRLAVNVLAVNPACLSSSSNRELLLSCAERHVHSDNKNIRLSVATLLYNVVFFMQPPHPQSKNDDETALGHSIVSIAKNILNNRQYEAEAILRTLQAIGTLVLSNASAKSMAKSLYMASLVEPAASPHGTVVKAAAKEVYAVLQ